MKRKIRLVAAALLLFISPLLAKERKTVVIIVDGIATDVLERLHVPQIYDIASKGALGESFVGGERGTYSQTPTISAVGYNTMLTGVWVNKHNVYGNSKQSPNYNYWSLFRIAKAQERPIKTAIYSSWTDNRTVLLGEGLPETDNLVIDIVCDGYDLDKVNYPPKEKALHVFEYDEMVSKKAAESIRTEAPDLSWVYLWYTDDAAHRFGDGAYLDEYELKAGEQIGRVWEAVKYREKHFDEEWLVVVTTDHGRRFMGYKHGGQSDRERRTWIATNAKVNKRFKAGLASMVDINPTVCRFMGFSLPFEVAVERDGVPFIGNLDITDMTIERYDNTAIIRWKAVDKKAPVSVYMAAANEYKETGKEEWTLLGTVTAGKEKFEVQLASLEFCKFALVAPDNSLNRWFAE